MAFWVSLEEMLAIRRYHDQFILDPTGGSNSKGFPWVSHVGADGNNKNITWGQSFLGTGELNRNFVWEVKLAMYKELYGKLPMEVEITITDGDPKICSAIDTCILLLILGGDRGRCFFHEVTQYFKNNILPGSCASVSARMCTCRRCCRCA